MSLSERRRRILDTVPIAVIMGKYLPLQQSGSVLVGLCPFHDDRSSTLVVEPVRGRFQCPVCGTSGDVVDFLCLFENRTLSEALDILEARPMT